MARPFGLGPKTLGLTCIIVVTCDETILKMNASVFADVFLEIAMRGDE
jgi:hypothetical protein